MAAKAARDSAAKAAMERRASAAAASSTNSKATTVEKARIYSCSIIYRILSVSTLFCPCFL